MRKTNDGNIILLFYSASRVSSSIIPNYIFQLEQMLGNRSEPTELSYVSQTREGNGDDDTEAETRRSGDGEEEEINSQRAQRRSVNDPDTNDSKNDGTIEVEEVAISGRKDQETGGQLGNGIHQGPKAKAPSFTRCYSAQPTMSPRTQRKLLKSHSVMAPIPLQSGSKSNMIFNILITSP